MTTMIAETPATPVRELVFVEPLPGFDDDATFTLSPIDPRGVLYALRSVHNPELRFVLTPPEAFFADYHPEIADEVGVVLGADEVEVLVVLSIVSGLADATANLRAPIVVAPRTGRAVQVILDDDGLPMDRPLLAS
jgi:flagellar assembly factor FliW